MATTGVQRAAPRSRVTSIFTSTKPAARIAPATTRDESSLEVAHTSFPPGRRSRIISAWTTSKDSRMRWIYAEALYKDPSATLDDLREAVTMLEETTRIARRVMGGAHPVATGIESSLRNARSVLAASEAGEDVVSTTLPPG